MLEALVQRLAALECRSSIGSIERDLRVITMQLARAEEKILRMDRSSSCWTRSSLLLNTTTEMS